jgi:hypothetical protein
VFAENARAIETKNPNDVELRRTGNQGGETRFRATFVVNADKNVAQVREYLRGFKMSATFSGGARI